LNFCSSIDTFLGDEVKSFFIFFSSILVQVDPTKTATSQTPVARPENLRYRTCEMSKSLGNKGSFAFSLLELLVVVAIALLLTTMYWGSHSNTRAKEQQTACLNNLQKLHIALEIYSNEQNGKFPSLAGARTSEEPLDLLVPKFNADLSLFICPASKDEALPSGEPVNKHKISYAYYMGRNSGGPQLPLVTDKQVDTLAKIAAQNVFSTTGKPPGNNHEKSGGNVLFCDGHAEFTAPRAAFALPLGEGAVLLNPKP